jgi:hypothetical protein
MMSGPQVQARWALNRALKVLPLGRKLQPLGPYQGAVLLDRLQLPFRPPMQPFWPRKPG